jgi:uncharacterized OB-fold protein
MADTPRPLPRATDITAPYWKAANEGALCMQLCQQCRRWQFFPRAFCVHCSSEDIVWQKTAGLGKVYTFTINRRAANPFMKERLPYAVAIVELDEGPRMMANIINSDLDAIRIDARVRVCFERVDENLALPQFELVGR